MTNQQKEFIGSLYNALIKYAPAYDIKAYPAILAQGALESAWGKSSLAKKYFNFWGMKCGSSWKGKSVNLKTAEEYTVGVYTNISANFRVYDSLEDGVKGYLQFINTNRYKNLKGVTDSRTYLELIKSDGYATSSKYVDNLMNVVNTYKLEDYSFYQDKVQEKKTNEKIAQEVISGMWGNGLDRKQRLTEAGYCYADIQSIVNDMLKPKKTHTVVKGDTLNKISLSYYGTNNRVQEIMELNNLSSTCIQIGLVLKLPN